MSQYSFHVLAAYRTNCIFPYKFYSARVNHLIKRAVCVLNFNVCTETFGHRCHKTAYAERIQADTEAHAASSPPNQKTPSSFFSFLFFSPSAGFLLHFSSFSLGVFSPGEKGGYSVLLFKSYCMCVFPNHLVLCCCSSSHSINNSGKYSPRFSYCCRNNPADEEGAGPPSRGARGVDLQEVPQ